MFNVCDRGHQWPVQVGVTADNCPVCGQRFDHVEKSSDIPWAKVLKILFALAIVAVLVYAVLAGVTSRSFDAFLIVLVVGGTMILLSGLCFYMALRMLSANEKLVGLIKQLGDELGFVYAKNMHKWLRKRLQTFSRISRSRCNHVLQGKVDGQEVLIFRFRSTQRHDNDHQLQPVLIVLPDVCPGMPDFQLEPDNLIRRMIESLTRANPEILPSIAMEEFEKLYRLRGSDQDRLKNVFHSDVIEYFAQNPGWYVESDGNHLLFYRHRGKKSISEALFDDRVPKLDELRALWDGSREIVRLLSLTTHVRQ